MDDFVRRLTPARERIEGVRVLGFVTREDGNRWVEQRMDEALELLRRLLPDSPTRRGRGRRAGMQRQARGGGDLRAASVVCTTARAPMFDVKLAGREFVRLAYRRDRNDSAAVVFPARAGRIRCGLGSGILERTPRTLAHHRARAGDPDDNHERRKPMKSLAACSALILR